MKHWLMSMYLHQAHKSRRGSADHMQVTGEAWRRRRYDMRGVSRRHVREALDLRWLLPHPCQSLGVVP